MSRVRSSLVLLWVLTTALGGAPHAVRGDEAPRGSSLYVANDRAETISAFHVDAATGALMPLAAAPAVATDKNPYSLAVEPAGRWLYVAHGDASSIVAFRHRSDYREA